MSLHTPVALGLALLSTGLINIAYVREHDAAAAVPALSIRRPGSSFRQLLASRDWMLAFGIETAGFLLYAAALALASLALVQSVAAGGIGLLAYVSARRHRRRLERREVLGVGTSVAGLCALGVSLLGGHAENGSGSLPRILVWLGVTAAVAGALLRLGPPRLGRAVTNGLAGGLLFSLGDISTKLATQGGARAGFVVLLMLGYGGGTSLLQIGYQAGGAVTVAGLATLLTNALPIVAGTVVLDEPVPSGWLGALRVIAFIAVIAGAVLLARPAPRPARRRQAAGTPAREEPPDGRLGRPRRGPNGPPWGPANAIDTGPNEMSPN